jgi:hypothetical protein
MQGIRLSEQIFEDIKAYLLSVDHETKLARRQQTIRRSLLLEKRQSIRRDASGKTVQVWRQLVTVRRRWRETIHAWIITPQSRCDQTERKSSHMKGQSWSVGITVFSISTVNVALRVYGLLIESSKLLHTVLYYENK